METDNYVSLRIMHNIGYTSVRIWQHTESFPERATAKLTYALWIGPTWWEERPTRPPEPSLTGIKFTLRLRASKMFVHYETFSNDCITKWVYRTSWLILYTINEKHTSKLDIKLFKLFQDICNIGTSFRIEVQYNNRNNSINVPNAIVPPNYSVTNMYIYITL